MNWRAALRAAAFRWQAWRDASGIFIVNDPLRVTDPRSIGVRGCRGLGRSRAAVQERLDDSHLFNSWLTGTFMTTLYFMLNSISR